MKNTILSALLVATCVCVTAGVVKADPFCQKCPYSCADLGLGHKDCSELSQSRGLCCVDLTQKGLKLAKAQDMALASAASVSEQCPSGFQPSEQKCSPKERNHGCKDVRLPGGLGCVRR